MTAITLFMAFVFAHAWLHITNPYAARSIITSPHSTYVAKDTIRIKRNFRLRVLSGPLASAVGYYKSGFLIVQNAWFGSYKSPKGSVESILQNIHRLRFDPSKPYLISGDQFSVLYPRNLGVFYNTLLNPHTAHDEADWQNRQRLYLQSALYALDAFSAAKTLTTTIVPVSPKSVVLTQVHPGSQPSDTLYGILYAFDALSDEKKYEGGPFPLQTADTTRHILRERRHDLQQLLRIYLQTVRDKKTGLIKPNLDLAAARDGSIRSSSFYDNVVLWKTLQLADKLGIDATPKKELNALRGKILKTFWLEQEGHFKDDLNEKSHDANYSSDWLIALPTGFLSPDNKHDLPYLEKCVKYIRNHTIDKPLPIKYTAKNALVNAPWAVRTFVPNYGGDAIWSYWGAEYITLLANLYKVTGKQGYHKDAERHIKTYEIKIVEYRGYPETFDSEGKFLQTPVYKSIRRTGWVVQFEHARWVLGEKKLTQKP